MPEMNINTKEMPLIKISEDMLIRKPANEYGIGYDIDLFMEFCIRINHYILAENFSAALYMAEHYDHYLLEMTSETRPLFVFSGNKQDQHKKDASSFFTCLRKMLANMQDYGDIMGADNFESPFVGDYREQNKLNERFGAPIHFPDQKSLNEFTALMRGMFDDNREEIQNILPLCFENQTQQSCEKAQDDYFAMIEDSPSVAERAERLALSIAESSRLDPGNYNNDHYQYSSALISSLKIPSGCQVFITHDHSSFKNGKNGFAVTDKGIYLIETMSSRVQNISYDELSLQEPEWEGSRFIIGNKRILFPCRERDQTLVFNFFNVIGKYCRFINSSAK